MGGGIIAIISVFIVIPSGSPRGGERYIGARIACEQALLFGRAKQASRERASEGLLSSAPRGVAARSCVHARLASLAQIGELARRLVCGEPCIDHFRLSIRPC